MNFDYIGGFIDAEGTISDYSHSLGWRAGRITICNSNLTSLQAIKGFLNKGYLETVKFKQLPLLPNGKRATKVKPQYRLQLHLGSKFASSLSSHIFVKRKKLESLFPLHKPFELSWSYLAGFFDGDGSLSFLGNTSWYFEVIEPNREILELMRKFIGEGYIYERYNANCLVLRICKRQVLQNIGEKLLPHCIIKKEKVLEMLTYFDTYEWHSNWKLKDVTKEMLEDLYTKRGLSIRKVASIFHVKYNPMREKLLKFSVPLRPLGTNQTFNIGGTVS